MDEQQANNHVQNLNQSNGKIGIKSTEYTKLAYMHVNFDLISFPPLPQVTLISLQLQILLQLYYLVSLSMGWCYKIKTNLILHHGF